MCVYASIGAWAQNSGYFTENGATTNNSEGASSWVYDGASTLTITLAKDSHLHPLSGWSSYSSAGAPWASYNNSIKKIVFKTTSTSVTYPDDFFYALNIAETFDFSSLSASQITSLYSTTSNFNHYSITGVLKNVIVPEGSAAAPGGYNTLIISDGVVSGYFKKGVDQIDWSVIGGTPTTLKWKENVTSAMTISSAAITNLPSTITTLDFTEVSVGATVTVDTPITTVYVADANSKANISGVTASIPFTGVVNAAGSSLQTNIENYLANYAGKTKDDIITLNVTGALTSADIEYIATLSNLTTLNLSAATGDVSNLASNSVTTLTLPTSATALPNNITTNLPNLSSPLYIYTADSDSKLTNLDIFLPVSGGIEAIINTIKNDLFGAYAQWSTLQATNEAVVKVSGNLNSADITNIMPVASSCATLDFSDATGITATDITGAHYVIKLPAGSEMPTDTQAANWNKGGGSADMIVYSISPNGKTISIWSNKVGTIANAITGSKAIAGYTGVDYALIVGKNGNNFSTDVTTLTANNINQALLPISYNGCEVTINRDFATGTMTSLISEAKTHLGSTDICTLKVTGELSTTDLESLDDANKATRIDLSETTLATGAAITSLQVPSTLVSLVLPPNQTVKGTTLANTLSKTNCPNLLYAYSPSSDSQKPGPDEEDQFDRTKNLVADYVWVNKAGGLKPAFENEEQLRNSYNIKVASSEELTATDVNFDALGDNKPSNYLFLNFSDANLTPTVAASYQVTDYIGYRIILPNNWTGDQMAVFAANPHCGNLAAVYSYNGTTLNIMEINDGAYSPAALADPRIMRSGTTEVDVISGYYDGNTYAQFGTNLLAALNNMGKSSFSVTTKNAQNEDVVTNYTNTLGQSVKTISIETTSAAPNALTFDNPSITTLKAENLVQNNAELKFGQCSALTTLDLSRSTLKSVSNKTVVDETTYTCTALSSVDFSNAAVTTTTDLGGATSLATFTTTNETIFNGDVDLTSSALTSLTSTARFGGDLKLNNSDGLTSVDVSGATFSNSTSVIHVDNEESEGETVIINLQATNAIKVPSSFEASVATRVHPYNSEYVQVASSVAAECTVTNTDMTFHDKETSGENPDKYRYWYQGTADSQKMVTLGTSSIKDLATVLSDNATTLNFEANTYVKAKIVGPLVDTDMDDLASIKAITLDLSDVTSGTEGKTIGEMLKTYFSSNALNTNTKFVILPDTCSREYILNATALDGLKNDVYCVLAIADTEDGRDLTSYSFVSGALQPAVIMAASSAANSWSKIPGTSTARNIYTSSVSNFKKLKISGLINSYDLSKADQKLDADGHLSWAEDVVESTAQTRTLNGDYNVYGPFSSCFLLTEIDLRDAYFEPKSTGEDTSVYFRYWYSDMTLSFLNVISTATYKVVIPQNSKVREVPADFMRCSTNIRAICIPSNIQAIRTRAFYTIDYVWTTADAYATGSTTSDPEGDNTRLDNKAKLSDGTAVSALLYENGKYKENPAFQNSYYTADYSGDKGGGTYTFGSTLKLIETGAFANTQPNVSDVYVLNTTAPECHVDAFNTVMYTGNGGYNPTAVSEEKIITRKAYYNGRWITMLHYPRQTTDPQIQRYTDPTRDYSIATGLRDGKGAILYFPNQSEFIRAYQQGTFGYTWNAWNPTRVYGSVDNGSFNGSTNEWTAELQTAANALFDAYTTGGGNHQYTSFYKVSEFTGKTVTAPTTTIVPYYNVNWSGSAYTPGDPGNLYPQSEIDKDKDADNSGEKTTKDYRGWHQFVLNAYAANTVLEEEPYRSYITDNEWWTIVPEFDITRSESALFFGRYPGVTTSGQISYPKIHKLRYVRREYSGETIYLNFTQDLATQREDRTNRKGIFTRADGESGEITAYTNADQHGAVDSEAGILKVLSNIPAGDDVVMSAGVPYLIKPNLPVNAKRQYIIFKSGDDAANYNNTHTAATDPVGIGLETLYAKIKFAQEMSGEDQRALVKSGTYTVPVFVSVADGEGVVKEAVEMDGSTPKTFRPDDEVTSAVEYYRSADRHYTFVGTLYKSFLPHFCYFLGWDSQNNCAKFYYHNGNFDTIDNEMRWANGTGVIVPVLAKDLSEGKFAHDVEEAKDMANPAQWKLLEAFADDSFKHTGGGAAKQYVMDFNAPDMIAVDDSEVTGIANVDATDNVVINGSADVYTVNGQKVGTSLEGLPKGIYIVNGKKFIVK